MRKNPSCFRSPLYFKSRAGGLGGPCYGRIAPPALVEGAVPLEQLVVGLLRMEQVQVDGCLSRLGYEFISHWSQHGSRFGQLGKEFFGLLIPKGISQYPLGFFHQVLLLLWQEFFLTLAIT